MKLCFDEQECGAKPKGSTRIVFLEIDRGCNSAHCSQLAAYSDSSAGASPIDADCAPPVTASNAHGQHHAAATIGIGSRCELLWAVSQPCSTNSARQATQGSRAAIPESNKR
jgi:hypothetical protein